MEYIAKSNPCQTLEQHTQDALAHYYKLKARYPKILSKVDWEILKTAVLYHDFGKMDIKFQNKIRKNLKMELLKDSNEMYDTFYHNYLSPAFLDQKHFENIYGEDGFDLLVKAIYYHHNRPELSTADKNDMADYIMDVLNEGEYKLSLEDDIVLDALNDNYTVFVENFDTFKEYNVVYNEELNQYIRVSKQNPETKKNLYDIMLNRYIKIKGLLNRIDYAASVGIELIEDDTTDCDGLTLGSKTKNSILEKKEHQLRKVQKFMFEHKNENIIISAATGCGKTEAALLWIDDSKAFYTLPLKVSINDIFLRIKNKINYTKVGLVHSDAFSIYLKEIEDENAYEQYSMSKLFSKPLTLCTIDQLFKFTYKYNGGELALATLSYSKLVIDEIQMYSPRLVAILIYGLKMLTELGGKFSIITATFPNILYFFLKEQGIPYYAEEQMIFHSPTTERHRIKLLTEKEFDFSKLITLSTEKKVLVICNTVTRAQEVYETLSSKCDVKLLHSAFLKKDRRQLENEILKFAPNTTERENIPGIWITTQIVEASLDIDFDVLFTEMCAIDSLLQRMGRVYRSRKYDMGDDPNVFILNNNNTGGGNVVDYDIYEFSLNAVKEFDGDLLEESDNIDKKQKMIDMVYHPVVNSEIRKRNYFKIINDTINTLNDLRIYDLSKDTVDQIFRDIDSITIIPDCIYNELDEHGKIEQWRKMWNSKNITKSERQELKDEISDYTVSLSYYQKLDINRTKECIYKGSKIYRYMGEYEFSDDNKGRGIIKKYKNSKNLAFDIFL